MLSIPHTGHPALAGDMTPDGCGRRAVQQFFAAQRVAACGVAGDRLRPAPVAPTRLARLPGSGSGDRVGRSISAALATAADVRRRIVGDLLELGRFPRRDGGLRGGRVTVGAGGRMTLRDVVYVPGVKISGSVSFRAGGTSTLPIGGSAAAHGRVMVTPGSITGRVGGRRVRLVAGAAASRAGAHDGLGGRLDALVEGFRLRRAG